MKIKKKNSLRADVSYFLFVACGKKTNLRFYSGFLWVLYECFTAFVERSERATKVYVWKEWILYNWGLNNLVILLPDQMKNAFVF